MKIIDRSKKLDYQHISLVPRVVSTLKSRSEADTGINAFGTRFDMPIIAAPMPDVCGGIMAYELSKLGALGIIHRFQSIEEQVNEYKSPIKKAKDNKYIACAIGVTDDYQDRFNALYAAGCRIFCLDTANGANIMVGEAIEWINKFKIDGLDRIYIIAGNVATAEGYRYLAELGVDAVRVGIAGGSVCETKTETGIYMPMVSAILECVQERNAAAVSYANLHSYGVKEVQFIGDKIHFEKTKNYDQWYNLFKQKRSILPLIIADGGIRTPADMCKALALGADFIMCGSILAGTEESPGEVLNIDGDLKKVYRGAASFGVQKEYKGKKPKNVEGRESLVPYAGHVGEIIDRFKAGLQSSMSYMNSRTLIEYRNSTWVEV